MYTVDYGDGTAIETYTHAELLADPLISHTFGSSTCSSNQAEIVQGKNYFKVDLKLLNKGLNNNCNVYNLNGNGTSKYVNTSIAPAADFTTIPKICENTILKATDTSVGGEYGEDGTCLTNFIKDWYFTPPGESEERVNLDKDENGNFVAPVFANWVDASGNLQIQQIMLLWLLAN